MQLFRQKYIMIMIVLYFMLMIPFIQSTIITSLYLLFPLFLAYIFSYLLRPVQKWLEGFRIHKSIAIICIIVSFFLLLFGCLFFVYQSFKIEGRFLQAHIMYTNWQSFTSPLYDYIPARIHQPLQDQVGQFIGKIDKYGLIMFAYVGKTVEYILYCTMIPFVMFFMMRDGSKWKALLLQKMKLQDRASIERLCMQVEETVGQYIKSQLYVSGILTGILFPIYWWMHLPFAFALALMMGLLNIIPFIGSLFGTLIVVIVASFIASRFIIYILLLHMLVQLIENSFISPYIIGRTVQIHPMIILLSMVFAAHIAGFIGVIWSVPIVLVIKVILMERKQNKNSPIYSK